MTEAAPVPPDLYAHAAFLRRLASTLLADPHGADDLVQDTLHRGLVRPPARDGDPRNWLAQVLRNFARRRWRTEERRSTRERRGAREEALPSAEASLERAEAMQRVADAVRQLDEPYRTTILARFYEDLPPRAIAEREGVPVETVNTRLKRGLAQLRRELAREQCDWLPALGLIAGRSPCLPPHAGEPFVPSLASLWGSVLAVSLGLGALVVWRAVQSSSAATPSSAAVASASTTNPPPSSEPAAPNVREPDAPLPEPPREAALSGRITDEHGAPVPNATVHVLGTTDPFGSDSSAPKHVWGEHVGRTFTSDEQGRWSAVLPGAKRVLVLLATTEVLVPIDGYDTQRWVDAPAADVDFVVQHVPSATLEVRVVEGATHRPLDVFRVTYHGEAAQNPDGSVDYTDGFWSGPVQGGVLRAELAVRDPAGRHIHVALAEPRIEGPRTEPGATAAQPAQDVLLLPGATEQVVFVVPERGVLQGQVVDGEGAPIEGALVFFGSELRLRGDEPFKPMNFERVLDGARTGPDGWYDLRGTGPLVTAVHADFSGATVEVARAGRIALGPRGVISGKLLDATGQPVAGATVRLDRKRDGPEVTTDAQGAFAFEGLERGAHAVWTTGEWPLACVRLGTGEERELTIAVADPPTLTLVLEPPPALESDELTALVVGRDALFDLRFWPVKAARSGTLEVAAPRPDKYWFVCDKGLAAPFVLTSGAERVVLALGTAELVVRGKVNSVQIVPADADAFLRLMAARLRVRLERERGATFHLAPGRYLIVGEGGEVLREVELPASGLEIELD